MAGLLLDGRGSSKIMDEDADVKESDMVGGFSRFVVAVG